MSMIKIENLTFSYPGSYDNVFENVNFQIDTDWKLGFVGRNGRGKTTLLNLFLGNYEYSGRIISSVEFDYFPYHVSDKSRLTEDVLQEICPAAEDWEIIRELSFLDVSCEVLYRPFEMLSEGEQTKALLAALFLNENHFLLIDEPTNHLDTDAREVTAKYLKKKKGFILVSHDRRFLDDCVDHILSLNKTDIEVQTGSFSTFMTNFEQQQKSEQAENKKLQKEIKQLRQSAAKAAARSNQIEKTKYGTGAFDKGYIGHKSAKMMKRSKSLEARQQQAIEQKASLLRNVENAELLKIQPLSYHSDTLVSLSDVSVCYGGNAVSVPVSFNIKRGERVVLDGKNGSGKSSLLKLVMGQPLDHTGTVSIGSGLIISYVPQNTSHLSGKLYAFANEGSIDENLFRAILNKMDIGQAQFDKDISDFSQGQKKKVLIAKSLCEKAHLYVWDEPLNFIDIYSRMQIEQLIERFNPTMLFIEHDETFRTKAATKVVTIEKNASAS